MQYLLVIDEMANMIGERILIAIDLVTATILSRGRKRKGERGDQLLSYHHVSLLVRMRSNQARGSGEVWLEIDF